MPPLHPTHSSGPIEPQSINPNGSYFIDPNVFTTWNEVLSRSGSVTRATNHPTFTTEDFDEVESTTRRRVPIEPSWLEKLHPSTLALFILNSNDEAIKNENSASYWERWMDRNEQRITVGLNQVEGKLVKTYFRGSIDEKSRKVWRTEIKENGKTVIHMDYSKKEEAEQGHKKLIEQLTN